MVAGRRGASGQRAQGRVEPEYRVLEESVIIQCKFMCWFVCLRLFGFEEEEYTTFNHFHLKSLNRYM